ncbi:MAG: SDR family oxidoreductase [Eubacteriales bacterium]|nr:SDR family oxidoreductase [Eubacteriales bacterium]
MKRLENKVALITGATKGIGETTARLFADEGAKVLICGRNDADGQRVEAEINAAHGAGTARYFKLDVTSMDNWKEAIDFAESQFGKLNILVNNAGISYPENVVTTTPEIWNKVIATNQTGVFYGMQQVIEAMARTGEPCAIVSTASVDGHVGDELYFAYCAAKAAVEAMTRCAALYCANHKLDIRVNAVAPGYILTPMAEEDARQNGKTIEEYCADCAELHPIGRLGRPDEIAKAYLYMASDDASFVTGTTLMVDGGYTAR